MIDPAPTGHPPTISADQAAAADPNRGQYRGHTPTVVYGLVTTPSSGKGRPDGGIDPQVDHQLDWIVWYLNVDIPGAGGAACADEPCPASDGPEIGDAVTIVDGQTGQALIGMFGRES